MHHSLFLQIGIILLATVCCQWTAWRFKFPVIVLLTFAGLLLGPGTGVLNPVGLFGELLNPLIELVVSIILFEGGLTLKLHEFRKVSKGLIRLFTVSILLQITLITVCANYLFNLDTKVAFILGALLVVTGPTVIIPALREARLKSNISHYLKWEGIVNDPIGAMLAIIMLQVVTFHDADISVLAVGLLKGNIIAAIFAFGFYKAIKWMVKRALIPEFLKIPFFLSIILIQFIFSNMLQTGAGLLAVTIFGILIGNSGLDLVKDLRQFKESLTTFSVSIIFIILASTLKLSDWHAFEWSHILFVLLVAFIIRPLSIILSTVKSGMKFKEQVLIGLYGPKGIVAASVAGIIGIELKLAGFSEEGQLFLPIVFSVVIVTVIVHSFYLGPLAKFFKLHHEKSNGLLIVGANPVSVQLAKKLSEQGISTMISDSIWSRLARARQAGINVHYGEIIADRNYGEPNLIQYNYLIAMSEDNSYNTLLCHVLGHEFGSDHVYALPSEEDSQHEVSDESDQSNSDEELLKFKERPIYYNLMKLFHQGATFSITGLSEEYNYGQFLKDHKDDYLLPLLIIRESKRIEFYKGKGSLRPIKGDKIVYYNMKVGSSLNA